jgi:methylated-DNA-[protein]-cysteine S-methyltransferase
MNICHTYLDTPVGTILLAGSGGSLMTLKFPSDAVPVPPEENWERNDGLFKEVKEQLRSYFIGGLQSFEVPLAPDGTPFQLKVWEALRSIPYGETISYRELAIRIGHPKAVRAVGGANGRNPIPVIIPCHRVIGSDGALAGFSGGIGIKKKLLGIEGVAFEER